MLPAPRWVACPPPRLLTRTRVPHRCACSTTATASGDAARSPLGGIPPTPACSLVCPTGVPARLRLLQPLERRRRPQARAAVMTIATTVCVHLGVTPGLRRRCERVRLRMPPLAARPMPQTTWVTIPRNHRSTGAPASRSTYSRVPTSRSQWVAPSTSWDTRMAAPSPPASRARGRCSCVAWRCSVRTVRRCVGIAAHGVPRTRPSAGPLRRRPCASSTHGATREVAFCAQCGTPRLFSRPMSGPLSLFSPTLFPLARFLPRRQAARPHRPLAQPTAAGVAPRGALAADARRGEGGGGIPAQRAGHADGRDPPQPGARYLPRQASSDRPRARALPHASCAFHLACPYSYEPRLAAMTMAGPQAVMAVCIGAA